MLFKRLIKLGIGLFLNRSVLKGTREMESELRKFLPVFSSRVAGMRLLVRLHFGRDLANFLL